MFFWKGCLSQSGDPQQRPAKKLPAAHPAGHYRRPNLYPRIAPVSVSSCKVSLGHLSQIKKNNKK